MSLTVADVLHLPGLESLRLRAGASALDNPVRWPYVAENASIAEWVLGGELVFVTGINHPRDQANLLQLLHEAHERGSAGVVILTGEDFIQSIPSAVIERAERLGLPLLEQPYALKMVVVTQAIGTALVQTQYLGQSRQEILQQLLSGNYPSLPLLLQRAQRLELPLQGLHQVAVLHLREQPGQPPRPIDEQGLQQARERLLQRLSRLLANARAATPPAVALGDQLIALLPTGQTQDAEDYRQALKHLLAAEDAEDNGPLRLYIGLSHPHHEAGQLSRALEEARQALEAARYLPAQPRLCCFSELGVLKLLAAIPERGLLQQFVDETLGPLNQDDARQQPVLLPSLEAWLQEHGNLANAANRLGVHRNTLSHRLQRIQQLSGVCLDDPHTRLNLAIALLIRRLDGYHNA